jgi:hypothetical protein
MKRILSISFFTLCSGLLAQNNALVLNGAYVTMSGGTFASPVYLVVNAGTPAAIQRNSGHIISEAEGNYVKWNTSDVTSTTNYVVPFGYSSSDYLPVTIHKNSVGSGAGHTDNSASMILSTWSSPVNNLPMANSVTSMAGLAGADAVNSVIDRWWQVQTPINVSATADMTYRGAENTTAFPTSPFNGQHWDIPSLQWTSPSGSGTGVTGATVGTVTGINLVTTGFGISSPYLLTSSSLPLPIELISFTAACDNDQMQINWVDATETNVMNIELQRSYDLNSWTTVYTASPSNSSSNTYYHFTDNTVEGNTVYYRLRTNNNDGGADQSAMIFAQTCGAGAESITTFYAEQSMNVHTHFSIGSAVSYQLFDIQGKRIVMGEFSAAEGDMVTRIPLNDMANGIYIFTANSTTQQYTQKILITDK